MPTAQVNAILPSIIVTLISSKRVHEEYREITSERKVIICSMHHLTGGSVLTRKLLARPGDPSCRTGRSATLKVGWTEVKLKIAGLPEGSVSYLSMPLESDFVHRSDEVPRRGQLGTPRSIPMDRSGGLFHCSVPSSPFRLDDIDPSC